MPIHDWSRVEAGVFRDIHNVWYSNLRTVLNERLLPKDYYVLVEQVSGDLIADVLTLHAPGRDDGNTSSGRSPGSVMTKPPQASVCMTLPPMRAAPADKQLTIRHAGNDRVVAILEIVSRGNKSSKKEFQRFLLKATEAIRIGVNLLIVDLQPTTSRDPEGIHGAICTKMKDRSFRAPADKPLTAASYVGMPSGECYVEPLAVGDVLPSMPLFLDEEAYVNIPLEKTYMSAFHGVPWRFKPLLEETISQPIANGRQ